MAFTSKSRCIFHELRDLFTFPASIKALCNCQCSSLFSVSRIRNIGANHIRDFGSSQRERPRLLHQARVVLRKSCFIQFNQEWLVAALTFLRWLHNQVSSIIHSIITY